MRRSKREERSDHYEIFSNWQIREGGIIRTREHLMPSSATNYMEKLENCTQNGFACHSLISIHHQRFIEKLISRAFTSASKALLNQSAVQD